MPRGDLPLRVAFFTVQDAVAPGGQQDPAVVDRVVDLDARREAQRGDPVGAGPAGH